MLQACRIITVWAALRADRQWMKLACVLTHKRASRSQLILSPVSCSDGEVVRVRRASEK